MQGAAPSDKDGGRQFVGQEKGHETAQGVVVQLRGQQFGILLRLIVLLVQFAIITDTTATEEGGEKGKYLFPSSYYDLIIKFHPVAYFAFVYIKY